MLVLFLDFLAAFLSHFGVNVGVLFVTRQYSAIFALTWGNSTGTHSSVPQYGRFDSLVSSHWKEFSCCLWSCKLQLTAAVARGSSHLLLLFKDVWWIWNGLVKYEFRGACKYTLAVISGGGNFAKRVKKTKRLSLKQFLESSGSAKSYKVVKKSLSFAWLVNLWIISCIKSRHWYKIVFPRPLTPTQSWKFFQDAFKYVCCCEFSQNL